MKIKMRGRQMPFAGKENHRLLMIWQWVMVIVKFYEIGNSESIIRFG